MTDSQTKLIDLSLEASRGLFHIFDRLFAVISEFNNLYLECKEVPDPQAHTHSAVSQCLLQLLHMMERKEVSDVADFIAQSPSVLNTMKQVVSTNKCA